MNNQKTNLGITCLVVIIVLQIALLLVNNNLGAPAKSLTGTEDPQVSVTSFFNALHDGDYDAADQLLGGCDLINADMAQESEVTRKLFDAVRNSISFEFSGEPAIDGLNASQPVRVTYFDVSSSGAKLNELSKQLLDELLTNTDDASVLYDENSDYRQEVVMDIFNQAVTIMLEDTSSYYVTREFDISLYYEDSHWFIEPSDDILSCMVGGMN